MALKDVFDISIIGAGPAGLACAAKLSGKGMRIAVFEKEGCSGNKVCGDAISPDALGQLQKIDPGMYDAVSNYPGKIKCGGLRLGAPSGRTLDLHFYNESSQVQGLLMPRREFDDIMFRYLQDRPDIRFFTNTKVEHCKPGKASIILETKDQTYLSKFVVGADGANSILHKLLNERRNKALVSMGIRTYAGNISGSGPENLIELHYLKGVIPGYFWIFPLANNQFNVGLGMPAGIIRKRKVNLEKLFFMVINTHPSIKERFRDAPIPGKPTGAIIPMGGAMNKLSGERFILTGDAAALVDPMSGEGIGNALRSGRMAASHIINAFESNRFDQEFNLLYDVEIKNAMWREFRVNRFIRRLSGSGNFVEAVISFAGKNKWFYALLKNSVMAPLENKGLNKIL